MIYLKNKKKDKKKKPGIEAICHPFFAGTFFNTSELFQLIEILFLFSKARAQVVELYMFTSRANSLTLTVFIIYFTFVPVRMHI